MLIGPSLNSVTRRKESSWRPIGAATLGGTQDGKSGIIRPLKVL